MGGVFHVGIAGYNLQTDFRCQSILADTSKCQAEQQSFWNFPNAIDLNKVVRRDTFWLDAHRPDFGEDQATVLYVLFVVIIPISALVAYARDLIDVESEFTSLFVEAIGQAGPIAKIKTPEKSFRVRQFHLRFQDRQDHSKQDCGLKERIIKNRGLAAPEEGLKF